MKRILALTIFIAACSEPVPPKEFIDVCVEKETKTEMRLMPRMLPSTSGVTITNMQLMPVTTTRCLEYKTVRNPKYDEYFGG